jgi:hypothetical protein
VVGIGRSASCCAVGKNVDKRVIHTREYERRPSFGLAVACCRREDRSGRGQSATFWMRRSRD